MHNTRIFCGITAVILLIAAIFVAIIDKTEPQILNPVRSIIRSNTKIKTDAIKFKTFTSKEDFASYMQKSDSLESIIATDTAPVLAPNTASTLSSTERGNRYSGTNVQIAGVDEPDIVKTAGEEIYISQSSPKTDLITAFPLASLSKDSQIDLSGNLLLDGNMLIIISAEKGKVTGYDVSNPKSTLKKWEIELDQNSPIVGARLFEGKFYLATNKYINRDVLCPITPLKQNGKDITIPCNAIYYPEKPISVDTTYTFSKIEVGSGTVEGTTTYVGSNSSSQVYMSQNNLYLSLYDTGDTARLTIDFYLQNKDIFPAWAIEKLNKLGDLDISNNSKQTEVAAILDEWQRSLSDSERLKVQNDLQNRMSKYMAKHRWEIESTHIVKLKNSDLSLAATGSVPGNLLSQFSMDEYKSFLRVVTTNDVYILDASLNKTGAVLDLGQKERIYAVRFIEDKGYIVAFRQTDPLYILDLADSSRPALKGELKIPGYFSYIHPIDKDLLLDIGQEGSQVKISFFDVSNSETPLEIDKYIMNENWNQVSQNSHAFLLDTVHKIFFLPGGQDGYVFSYANNKLELKKAIADININRAVYINNYLYVIGDNNITVFDENTWQEVGKLSL